MRLHHDQPKPAQPGPSPLPAPVGLADLSLDHPKTPDGALTLQTALLGDLIVPGGVEREDELRRLAARAAIGAPPLPECSPSVVRAQGLAALPLKAFARLQPGSRPEWLLGVPSRGELSLFGSRVTYSTAAAHAALGWTPRVQIAEGLIDTVEWLRHKGLAC